MPNKKGYKITCFLKKISPVLYAKGKCFNSLCREPSTQLISQKLIFLRRLGTSLKDDPSRHQYSCPSCVEVFRDLSLRIFVLFYVIKMVFFEVVSDVEKDFYF